MNRELYSVWCRTQDEQICELKKGTYSECFDEFYKCGEEPMIDVALFGPIGYDYHHIIKNNIDITQNPDIEVYC